MPRKKTKTVKRKTSKKVTKKKAKKKAQTRVRTDPLKEYAEAMKKQGIASVSRLSNDECISNITGRISTKSIALDRLLRTKLTDGTMETAGGIPLSRVMEIFGPPHVGKSTLLDAIFSEVQRIGGVAILVDTEVSRDRHYTERQGVDLDKLQYLEFERGEAYIENVITAAYETIDFWAIKSPKTPVIIGWDALGGTGTKDEWDKGIIPKEEKDADGKKKKTNTKPGAAAKAMHMASRQLAPRLGGTKISFIILNHEYEKINTMPGRGGGPKRETYGGSGPRHSSSTRMQLYFKGTKIVGSKGVVLGKEIGAKLVKNRLGSAMIEARLGLIDGKGVDNVYSIFTDLKTQKIIVTSGSWSVINLDGEEIKFQGFNGLNQLCQENPELFGKLYSVWDQVM